MKLMLTLTQDALMIEQLDESANPESKDNFVQSKDLDSDEFEVEMLPMPTAALILGYSLPFMNEICKRAYYSQRPFYVEKDKHDKYLVDAEDLRRFIQTCPDFNPYELFSGYACNSDDEDALMDDTVFMLNEDMLPQVCGVQVDEKCAPLAAYNDDAARSAQSIADCMEQFLKNSTDEMHD